MGSNQFGNIFRITTWGESHGKAVGVVIDGCPAGLPLTAEEISLALSFRAPGRNDSVSPRKEADIAEIYSGVWEGQTTGAPISIVIFNHDVDSSKYEPIKDLLRPSHAHYTYKEKYGVFDHRGGGRASGRETACRVAAGAVAKKLLVSFGIELVAFLTQIGPVAMGPLDDEEVTSLREKTLESPLFCPDPETTREMLLALEQAKEGGDSLGGMVELRSEGLPVGLGDPVYERLDGNLAKALMSIPACKGVEVGSGFAAAEMKGSVHNDLFDKNIEGRVITTTNHSGGIQAGISNGMPLIVRAAFKPSSSIQKPQSTLNEKGEAKTLSLPAGSRHDPCVAIRAVPVVEAMGALVLADALLMNRTARLFPAYQ